LVLLPPTGVPAAADPVVVRLDPRGSALLNVST
jgi:hypothetical protein